ncbi:MAG: hypothetical protein ACOZCL_07335 [Bacillota bacterium]
MILIYCTESCIYQDDGHCTLDTITSLKNTTEKGCEYYEENKKHHDYRQIT